MSTQLQLRRGNTAQTSVFTGAIAEVTVDTDKKTIVVHDGVTVGGYPLALEQTSSSSAAGALAKANSAFDQANLAFDKANSANILAQQAYDASNSAVTTGQANVGAGLISVTNAYQINVGSGLISVRNDYQANVGDLRIDTETANTNLKNYVDVANTNLKNYVDTANTNLKNYVDVANTNLKNYTDNTFLPKTGGTISGNLNITGNVLPTTDNVYFLGSETYRWHSIYVGPGSINLGGIVLGNTSGTISIAGATDLVLPNSDSPGLKGISDLANSSFDQANLAYSWANSAYDFANTRFSSSGGTVSGDVTITGNLSISGNVTSINTTELNVSDNEIILNSNWQQGVTPTQNAGITVNRGGSNVYVRYDETNDYWVLRDNTDQYIIATTANVGAGDIAVTNASQANVGAGLISVRTDLTNNVNNLYANIGAARITDVAASQANVGSGLIDVRTDLTNNVNNLYANIGAARITDVGSAQANTGAALIDAKSYTDTANTWHQGNTGAGLLLISTNITNNVNNLYANIGAARITDVAASQANVGSGLIDVRTDLTNNVNNLYANIGAARIADTAAAQANVGAGLITTKANYEANVGAGLLSLKVDITDLYNDINILNANIGAARIADTAAGQANVGAGLILVRSDYEANVGAARIADTAAGQANVGAGLILVRTDLTNNVNALYANIGAARITDTSASQANTGSALIDAKSYTDTANTWHQANTGAAAISITNAYQANVGAAKIIALGRADSAFAQANLAFDAANNVAPQIQPTRDHANNAFAQANLAYNTANTKLSSSGGTLSGDLTVTGNLTVSGNVFSVEATNLSVEDNMIYLNANNTVANPDLGFAGNYNDGTYHHAGLFRDASDGIWKFYYNYSLEPDASPYIDITHSSFRIADLTANLITDVITLRGLDPLNYSNTINSTLQANIGAARIADTAAAQANTGAALITAKSYTDTANTYLQSKTVAGVSGTVSNNQILTGLLTVDGSGSGLDADLWDGNQFASYLNQAVLTSSQVQFDTVWSANNGNGTNFRVGDDAWIGDYNIANTIKIKGQQDATHGYISFGSNNSQLGVQGAGQLTYGGNNLWHAGNDGDSSGLDADLLDGQHGSYYTANTGAGLLTKVSKTGDTVSGVLTITGGDGTYSSLELNGYNQRGGAGYHGFLKANNTNATNGAKHFRINSVGALEIVNNSYTATIFAVSDTGDISSVNSIRLPDAYRSTGTITTSSTSQTTLTSFSTSTYRSAKYLVQMTSGSSYHMIELSLIHDGTTVYLSQYGEVKTGSSLGTFDASIATGTLSILFTPTNASTVVKFSVHAIVT